MDKSRQKRGLHSAVQSAEMMVGKASDQKLPSVVAKSKITTPAPEPDLPSLSLAQVSIEKLIFTVYVRWSASVVCRDANLSPFANYRCFEIKTTVECGMTQLK